MESPVKKKRISKLCLSGFILSCLGMITFFTLLHLNRSYTGGSDAVRLTVLFFITLSLSLAFILSVSGVVSASRYGYRFRVLGILGIIISCIPLSLALCYIWFLLFHESPPQPPKVRA